MERIEQRTSDDCSVCAVAMLTGRSYEDVLAAAETTGYQIGSGVGCYVADVIDALGLEPRFKRKKIIRRPCIVSVESINQEGFHAVVLDENGALFDPSNRKQVTLDHVYKTASWSYFIEDRNMDDFPRRYQLDKMTKEERTMFDALGVVEMLGAHPMLTDAVVLIGEAKDKLSDWHDAGRPGSA